MKGRHPVCRISADRQKTCTEVRARKKKKGNATELSSRKENIENGGMDPQDLPNKKRLCHGKRC